MEIYLDEKKTVKLRTSETCAWIEERHETRPRKGVKNSIAWKRVTGYYGDLASVIKNYFDKKTLSADICDLYALAERIAEIDKKIDEMLVPLQKAFTAKRVADAKKGARK